MSQELQFERAVVEEALALLVMRYQDPISPRAATALDWYLEARQGRPQGATGCRDGADSL